jgi:hypothetical protein
MRRFAVLRHDVKPGEVHWDLLVEGAPDGKLFTWRLAAPLPARGRVAAERSFDHRALYLEYEGEISGGRGTVKREAAGSLTDVSGEPTGERYRFRCELGTFEITRSELIVLGGVDGGS